MTGQGKSKQRFLLGAPLREDLYETYKTTLINRFSEGDPKVFTEKGVDYINRVLDRQINKARGLLTYNALLVTAINTVVVARTPRGAVPVFMHWIDIGRILALASCIPLLAIFYLIWGPAEVFKDAASDFAGTYNTLRQRTYLLTVAIYATLLATLIALCLVLSRFY